MRSSFNGALSPGAYNLAVGAVLAEGMLATVIEVSLLHGLIPGGWLATLLLIVVYFVLSFVGFRVAMNSDSPGMSFLGYNIEVFAVSLLLSTTSFVAETAIYAAGITLIVTIMMTIAGSLFPDFFNRISGALIAALVCLFITELILLLFTHSWPGFVNIIGAVIFSGFIAVDWARAHHDNFPTLDGAVDACCSLYLDIVNLFLYVYDIICDNR